MVYQNDEILSNELFDPFSLAWEVFLQLAFSKSNRSISEMEQIRVWILSSVDEGRNARALGTLKKFLDQNKAAHISDKIYVSSFCLYDVFVYSILSISPKCLLYHYMSSEVYSELLEYADSSPFFDLIGLLHCVYSSSYQSCLHFWNVRFMVKETRSCPEFWLSLEQYA